MSVKPTHAWKPTHVWIFDSTRRVYGENKSSPIWREHWRKLEITGETSRSWLAGSGYGQHKIPKKGPPNRHVAWSEAEIDNLEWDNATRYKIIRATQYCAVDQLIQIAQIVGIQGPKSTPENQP